MHTRPQQHGAWLVALAIAGCGSDMPETTAPDAPGMQVAMPTRSSELDRPRAEVFAGFVRTPGAGASVPVDHWNVGAPPPARPTVTPPHFVVPTDERAAVVAATPPPPISGGTLLVTASGQYAVAADSDRDRVSVVDLSDHDQLHATIALQPGDEPGRVVEDDVGRVHVALRRGAAIASVDPSSGVVLARRAVCAEPRGLAFDGAKQQLTIACKSGQLLSLPADPLNPAPAHELARLPIDLRDVLLADGQTFVSRFKRPELLTLDAGANLVDTQLSRGLFVLFPGPTSDIDDALAPTFGWRTLRAHNGRMFMVHEVARSEEVDLEQRNQGSWGSELVSGAYGGGARNCGGVVMSALSSFQATGRANGAVRLPGVLPVDAALNADDTQIAVVFAGTLDPRLPQPGFRAVVTDESGAPALAGPRPGSAPPALSSLAVFELNPSGPWQDCRQPLEKLGDERLNEPTAVALGKDGFVALNREPAQLFVFAGSKLRSIVELGGDSVADTGHDLFHHDAGGGVACASCHAEGGEDGHVWFFSGFGPRRTQALNVGLAGTAPFHWGGDLPDVPALLEDTLVTRMGGPHESTEREDALQHWLFALRPPVPLRAADDPAVLRGKAVFVAAQCWSCHSGEKLTNNANFDVGTGESLQVPSLIGVGYRGPWLHTGCADTLRERFDPRCGGDEHGESSELTDPEIDDLIAYLESL
jgi:mono/diheme cytochrome c family protein